MDGNGVEAAIAPNISRNLTERHQAQYQSDVSVSRRQGLDRPQATATAEKHFVAILDRRRRTTTVL